MFVRVTGFREVAGHTSYEIETRQGDGEPTTVLLRYSDILKYHTTSGTVQAFPVPKRLVNTQRVKAVAVSLAALAVAAATAVSGLIGFVGLVAPHLIRLVLGPGHRALLPGAALCGAALLVFADLAARLLLAPAEIPIGIVTALVGGPFFLWLLVRQRPA